jgi:hypothetical protein
MKSEPLSLVDTCVVDRPINYQVRDQTLLDTHALLQRSAQLHAEADWIIRKIRLYDVLQSYGEVYLTGSYLLDVMVYPDLDLYIPPLGIEQLFKVAARLAQCELVCEVKFQKSYLPELPGGYYMKAVVDHGNWGRPWKVDIWSVDEALISTKMAEMSNFKQLMTEELRQQTILFKTSLINDELRTPICSGYFTYKAFLEEGLRDFTEIRQYLINHGIQL